MAGGNITKEDIRHDDIVDALGLVGQLLDRITVGSKPKPPERPKIDSGYRPYQAPGRLDDWRVA